MGPSGEKPFGGSSGGRRGAVRILVGLSGEKPFKWRKTRRSWDFGGSEARDGPSCGSLLVAADRSFEDLDRFLVDKGEDDEVDDEVTDR